MAFAGLNNPFFKTLVMSTILPVIFGTSQALALKHKPKAEDDWITYRNERFGFRLYYPSAIYSVQNGGKTEKTENDAPEDASETSADTPSPQANEDQEAEKAPPLNKDIGNIAIGPAKKEPSKDSTAIKQDDPAEVTGAIETQTGSETYKPDTADENPQSAETDEEVEKSDSDGSSLTLLSKEGESKIVVFGALNDDRISPREYRKTLLEEFGGYDKLDYQPVGKTWFVLSGFRGDTVYYQKVMFSCGNRVVNVFSINFPIDEKAYYEPLVEIMEDNFRTGRGTDTPSNCQ